MAQHMAYPTTPSMSRPTSATSSITPMKPPSMPQIGYPTQQMAVPMAHPMMGFQVNPQQMPFGMVQQVSPQTLYQQPEYATYQQPVYQQLACGQVAYQQA